MRLQLSMLLCRNILPVWRVQAFAAEEREFKKFKSINKEHRNANIKAIFAYSVFFPVWKLVSGLIYWVAGMVGSKELNACTPEAARNIGGNITAFILCLNLLFRPLRVIADKFNVLQMGMIASERVFKVWIMKILRLTRWQL